MYFRNKFNKEFLYLCDHQEPKGGVVRLDDNFHQFWSFRRKEKERQPKTIQVIPLLLFNHIRSSNKNDRNVEDYMMVCIDKGDTVITCYYDEKETSEQSEDFICDMGITNLTGDLIGK